MIRHRIAGVVCAALVPFAVPAAAPCAQGLADRDYWGFADRLMGGLDARWDPARGAYRDAAGELRIRDNGSFLITHAIAAADGHTGPARQDERARRLVDLLTAAPPWRGRPTAVPEVPPRSRCWGEIETGVRGHAAVDAAVAEALAWAWRARRPLGLAPRVVARIERQVGRCGRSRAWRYPDAVRNQVNWHAEVYAAAATVTRDGRLLRRDLRRQLERFAAESRRPGAGLRSTNLGTGYEFHYWPAIPAGSRTNFDSPEYANIVVDAIGHHSLARRMGMRPLRASTMRLMRAWVQRLLAGSWTHAGYLNWDTGLGHRRWHSAQYWAFAQQGLLAIASAPAFLPDPRYGRWAKALFGRALELYRRLADEAGDALAPPRMFGVRSDEEAWDAYAARTMANAARAVGLGLGARPSQDPPPLYSYDPATGRLAVTTPAYSTAVVPDNRGAFAYGGIELARLFGRGQRVAANVGGVPPAAFGIVVRDPSGRTLLASQRVRARPLRLMRAPRKPPARLRSRPARPYAGPFKVLEAAGAVARRGARVRVRHRFGRAVIRERWTVGCARRCAARATFPTWGADAAIDVLLDDGRRVRLAGPGAVTGATARLGEVARIRLGRGYTVTPVRGPARATLTAVATRPQRTNPDPGPSLAIDLPRGGSELSVALRPGG